jgi:integrase
MPPAQTLFPAVPAHTLKHRNCPICAGNLERVQKAPLLPGMTFSEAAPLWLAEHKSGIEHKTFTDYEYYIRGLSRFFGDLQLDEIHAGHLKSYADEREATAGASCINHEINTVKQILSRAELWTAIAKFYTPLKIAEPTVGQAMEPAAEQLLFEVASTEPRWRVAYFCSILTATTTTGPGEITHLHVNDIDFGESPGAPMGTLRVRDGLKNGYRARIVPLNESSRWAAGQLLNRHFKILHRLKLESNDEHFLLPGRTRRSPYNPWKPMGSWKKAWGSLRAKAGMPTLRMYDLRHHALTKLMEDAEVSEGTIEEMAGHALSSRMKKRYSHIRMKPKSDATAKLELKLPRRPVESVREDGRGSIGELQSRDPHVP